MTSHWHRQLGRLSAADPALLKDIGRGIEKESLRIDGDGTLARTPHPAALGSALTHTSITTDYSEALLEFITPVARSIEDCLGALEDIHGFVYRHLHGERLWSASMPCIVGGDDGIPVARYGNSHVGRMKTIYRYGLGHRYGRMMQAIAGIHYNFSMPERYWPLAQQADGDRGALQDYITTRYLGLIRNFRRWSWLLIYLFGASPAVCASFMRGRGRHHLHALDNAGNTLHLPHATALRMGDLGYSSSAQASLRICYNSLANYLSTLVDAIFTAHAPYAEFRGQHEGEYRQLNDRLLQIENEFYSSIRPKRPARRGETALTALHERGIEYVEIRCIDVSPFHPLGISAQQIRFMDAFLVHCLSAASAQCDEAEQDRVAANMRAVVNEGRRPGLRLEDFTARRELGEWAEALLDDIQASATLLDAAHQHGEYSAAVATERAKVRGEQELPSARLLREVRERGGSYCRLALDYSQRWAEHFAALELSEDAARHLGAESRASLRRQAALERGEAISFEAYLEAYYAQYNALRTSD